MTLIQIVPDGIFTSSHYALKVHFQSFFFFFVNSARISILFFFSSRLVLVEPLQ